MMDGRYHKDLPEMVRKLRLLGTTYKETAEFLGITEARLRQWIRKYTEFNAAMQEAGAIADATVVQSLYKRACGYSHPEDKIFAYKGDVTVVPTIKHYPPDTAAAQFWLQTRQRDKWGKQAEDKQDELNVDFNVFLNPANDPLGNPVQVSTDGKPLEH